MVVEKKDMASHEALKKTARIGLVSVAIALGLRLASDNHVFGVGLPQSSESTPALTTSTYTPTPTFTPEATLIPATEFPPFGPTVTLDPSDLKCKAKDLKHFHVPGVVAPIGSEFGDALTNSFIKFYNSAWESLGLPTISSFKDYGLVHPIQIISVENLKQESFTGYREKINLFSLDVQPMESVNEELDKLTQQLSVLFPKKTPEEIRIQLQKDFQIESIVSGKDKKDISVVAYMNAVDDKGNIFSYLTKYGKGLVDTYHTASWVVDGKTVNGYNSLKNRQGFIVKVTVENGKVKTENGFEGLRIDYDDFTEENCKTGSNNVSYPTKTPTPDTTPTATIPGQESPTPTESPEGHPTPTPTEFTTATSQPSIVPTRTPELWTQTPEPPPTSVPTVLSTQASSPTPEATTPPPPRTPKPTRTPGAPSEKMQSMDYSFLKNYFSNIINALMKS